MQKSLPSLVLFLILALQNAYCQPGLEKCSPSIQWTDRSMQQQEFQLVVRDLPAFLERLKYLQPGIDLVRTYAPGNIAVVRTSFSILKNQLLPLPELLYVDRSSSEFREELPVPGHNLFVNKINVLQAQFPDWNGAGRTVSIKENLFDTLDVDLWGRIAPVLNGAKQFSPHAALMATLAAGAGNSDAAGRGVAWGARVAASDFAGLLPDADSDYNLQGISVQNHSYGVGIENYYGADAMAYDQSVALRPSLLHVFSAGNSGDTSAVLGTYAGLKGFANLSGSFKMAKNVLLVGAVDSFAQVVPFSSRGPAYDGRIKPDLVAFGQDGSSGAAALVSGAAAVLQQAYAENHQGALSSAALVRALLINGADDIGAPGPDYSTGFGNLHALRSAQILQAGHYAEAAIGTPDTFFLDLDVPASARFFKITLAWDDPPAMAGAAAALVHDLDMKLYSPDGQKFWQPLVLNSAPQLDSLRLPAISGHDTLNTVEQIVVTDPPPGMYRLEISASKVPAGVQPFSIVYHWIPADTFSWIMPDRVNPPLAGEAFVLFWEESFDQIFGRLEYRYADQAAWSLIDAATPLQAGAYRWVAPDTFALLQLRMTIDGRAFLSDTFLLGPELRLRAGFYCPDSTLLFWNMAAPTATYQIWGLGDKYLEPLLVSADTFAVLGRDIYPQNRLAVSPLAAPSFLGKRSSAVDVSQQGLDCYFQNILVAFDGPERVRVQFQLGTTYGLQQVNVEKLRADGGWVLLERWTPPFANVQFETTDEAPAPGPNSYRARLVLPDDSKILSDTVTVYHGGPAGFWVYPNPASGRELLQVAVQQPSEEVVFVLFDLFGRLLLETTMEENLETIPLPALPPGLYTYAFRENGCWLYSGKLLVGK